MNPKKYLRLKKSFQGKDLRYEDNKLFMKDVPGGVMPMDIFVLMCNALTLDSATREKHSQIIFDAGKSQGSQILSVLMGEDKLPLSVSNIELLLKQICVGGMGELHMVRFSPHTKTGMIRVSNSSFATQYTKLLSIKKEPVDHFLAGMISGTLEYLFEEPFEVKEVACVVQGKPDCLFEVSAKKSKSKK